MGVLIYKKKDIKLYVIEIISYVFVTVLFVISNNIVNNLTNLPNRTYYIIFIFQKQLI